MAYFDNAATTYPKPEMVYKFIDKFYREFGVNVGRGQHKMAFTASKLVAETRELLLSLFHCPAKKVVFTPSATIALNIILQGIQLTDGCNIYITPFEHNSVTRVLHHLETIYRLNISTLSVDKKTMQYDMETIKYQFAGKKPNVVIMSHASNVCGVIAPIAEICTISKSYGAINIIDMCQTAGLIDTDLCSSIYDYAVFAGHKMLYGPFGVGGFICSETAKLRPLFFGGTGIDSANQELPITIPERFEVGSPDVMAIAGLNASLNWLNATGNKSIFEKERQNHHRLLSVLENYPNITVVKPQEASIGVVSCVFKGYSSDSIGQILSNQGIAVRTGLHCAPYTHRFLDTFPSGTVRFSVSYFNAEDDFKELEQALDYIAQND